jgi:hypothetical protein
MTSEVLAADTVKFTNFWSVTMSMKKESFSKWSLNFYQTSLPHIQDEIQRIMFKDIN